MTVKQIETEAKKASVPFSLAAQIRAILDAARDEYGKTAWDEADVEGQVAELVFGE